MDAALPWFESARKAAGTAVGQSVFSAARAFPHSGLFGLFALWSREPAQGQRALIRTAFPFLMHFKSPTGGDRYANNPSADRWVLPEGLGPDELAAELTARFWDRIRFFAMRRLRDMAAAEDVAQETLRRTLEALRAGRIEKPEALPSFLFETARHVCMHRTRSSGRQAKAFQRFAAEGEEDASPSADPLSGLISEERCEKVRLCLAKLEESDRRLLALSYEEGLGAEEIGHRLGATAGAVRVRRHRALARLAELMGVTRGRDREQG